MQTANASAKCKRANVNCKLMKSAKCKRMQANQMQFKSAKCKCVNANSANANCELYVGNQFNCMRSVSIG